MSNIDSTSEIIDIEPENIIEGKAEVQAKAKPAKSWRGKIALALCTILLSSVGGAWLYRDLLSSYLPSDQVQAMTVRMDGLEATTKTLNGKVQAVVGLTDEMRSQLAAAQAAVTEVAQLQTDSTVVKSSVAELQKSLAAADSKLEELKLQVSAGGTAPTNSDVSPFISRLEALEKDVISLKQAGQSSMDTTLLSQSLADLKAKIAAGTAYKDEIDRIAVMVPAAEGLDVLQSHALQGLPNANGLATELRNASASLPKAQPAAAPDDSWWGYAGSLVSELVIIKTAGTEDWGQVAVQAATLAEQGNLSSAVTNLKKLEGALPIELQTWHDRAVARLNIEQAIEKTSAAVLRQIAAKG